MMDGKEKHYSKKHEPGAVVNPRIEAALREHVSSGQLPCAVAFKMASELQLQPKEVGHAADLLEIRLVKCQLGLFGYPEHRIVKPAEHISEDLEKAIQEKMENGRLPCEHAWGIAKHLGVPKIDVSSACEAVGIKISSCQLGAF